MKKLKEILLLVKKTLTEPSAAAADFMSQGKGFGGPMSVYFAYCAAYALFIYFKPADFPADFSETAREFSGRSYLWLFSVQAFFELAFTVIFCALFPVFAGFFKEGRLAYKFLSSLAVCCAYAAASFYFRAEPLFTLPFLAAACAAAYAGARRKKNAAQALFRFSLTVNAAVIFCLPAYILAAILRSETFYTAAQALSGIWLTILTIKAARTLFGGTAARSALALIFSMTAAVSSFYILKNLGLVPPSIFRFMMFM